MNRATSLRILVALAGLGVLVLSGTAVGPAGATEGENNTTQRPDDVSLGTEISSFMQASSAETAGDVESGRFNAALNRTDDEGERRERIEERRARLEERNERLRTQRAQLGETPDVRNRSIATRIAVGASEVERSINETRRAATGSGLDTERLEEMRTNARTMKGPDVAELAGELAGPPDDVPGLQEPPENGPDEAPEDRPGRSTEETPGSDEASEDRPGEPRNGGSDRPPNDQPGGPPSDVTAENGTDPAGTDDTDTPDPSSSEPPTENGKSADTHDANPSGSSERESSDSAPDSAPDSASAQGNGKSPDDAGAGGDSGGGADTSSPDTSSSDTSSPDTSSSDTGSSNTGSGTGDDGEQPSDRGSQPSPPSDNGSTADDDAERPSGGGSKGNDGSGPSEEASGGSNAGRGR